MKELLKDFEVNWERLQQDIIKQREQNDLNKVSLLESKLQDLPVPERKAFMQGIFYEMGMYTRDEILDHGKDADAVTSSCASAFFGMPDNAPNYLQTLISKAEELGMPEAETIKKQ